MDRQNRTSQQNPQPWHHPCGEGAGWRLRRGLTISVFLGLAVIVLHWVAPSMAQPRRDLAEENRRCLECHGQTHIGELDPSERIRMVGTRLGLNVTENDATEMDTDDGSPSVEAAAEDVEPAERPALYVRPDALDGSVHQEVSCVECHADARELPHAAKLNLFSCATECHEVEATSFEESIHAEVFAGGLANADAPGCAYCHGGHAIQPVTDPTALVYRLQSVQLCGECHRQHEAPTPEGYESEAHIDAYLDSTHGRAVTQRGLIVAATCADCHGMHDVRPAADPLSLVHRDRVPTTCGQCHIGVEADYEKSVHGKLLAEGNERAPICTDCHTAHRITNAFGDDDFLTAVVGECGECHDQSELAGERRTTFYETYRASYHGQVNSLGSKLAARCSDCHGYHDILPVDDPDSRIHVSNLQSTCGTEDCHPNATARFVQFDPHADYRDRERYPLLFGVWLYFVFAMTGAFGFFGLHSILWFLRSVVDRVRFGPQHKPVAKATAIRRFTFVNRINHAFVIITFFGLTATGLPLVFSGHYWSGPLIGIFGGVQSAGVLHRLFAVMLGLNFVVHFAGLAVSAWRCYRRESLWKNWITGPNSMIPRWKDFTDCAGMFRWFIVGGKKPKFDRFTYWEKFDYWAEVGGSGIIGVSGLLLWFPEIASMILPGWIFNVAMVVHGYEALLAICFIFTIHFFNAHLRMEKFPVDDVMFTGSLPEEEFRHERSLQYDRLVEAGRFEELRIEAPPKWQRSVAVLVGILAMLIGTTLVVLIILSGIENLNGSLGW